MLSMKWCWSHKQSNSHTFNCKCNISCVTLYLTSTIYLFIYLCAIIKIITYECLLHIIYSCCIKCRNFKVVIVLFVCYCSSFLCVIVHPAIFSK